MKPQCAATAVAIALCACGPAADKTPVRYHPRGSNPTGPTSSGTFARGDSPDRVRAVMGNPDASNETGKDTMVWHYRFSSVMFRGQRVIGWNDVSKVLKSRGSGETGDHLAGTNGPTASGSIGVPTGFSGANVLSAPGSGGVDQRYVNPNQTYIGPYTRSDGTQVGGHMRTMGNSTTSDNIRRR